MTNFLVIFLKILPSYQLFENFSLNIVQQPIFGGIISQYWPAISNLEILPKILSQNL